MQVALEQSRLLSNGSQGDERQDVRMRKRAMFFLVELSVLEDAAAFIRSPLGKYPVAIMGLAGGCTFSYLPI